MCKIHTAFQIFFANVQCYIGKFYTVSKTGFFLAKFEIFGLSLKFDHFYTFFFA